MNRLVGKNFLSAVTRDSRVQRKTMFHYGMDEYYKRMAHGKHAAEHGVKFWGKMTYLVSLPALVALSIYMYFAETEHMKHPRPEYVPYEHLYTQKRPFPWGDGKHSLFHNPEHNPVPGVGYEVPDPNAGYHVEHH